MAKIGKLLSKAEQSCRARACFTGDVLFNELADVLEALRTSIAPCVRCLGVGIGPLDKKGVCRHCNKELKKEKKDEQRQKDSLQSDPDDQGDQK